MAPTIAPSTTLGSLICQMMAELIADTETDGCQGRCRASVPRIALNGTSAGPIAVPATSAMISNASAMSIGRAMRVLHRKAVVAAGTLPCFLAGGAAPGLL